jgi:hypothetical protein
MQQNIEKVAQVNRNSVHVKNIEVIRENKWFNVGIVRRGFQLSKTSSDQVHTLLRLSILAVVDRRRY